MLCGTGGENTCVEDLESKNGTRARGTLVSGPTMLADGDVVTFGGVEARFETTPFDETATTPL